MKRSKFTEEQIFYALRQAESGTPIGDLCLQYGMAAQTFLDGEAYAVCGGYKSKNPRNYQYTFHSGRQPCFLQKYRMVNGSGPKLHVLLIR